jgi:galactoside O-acetyltransferase
MPIDKDYYDETELRTIGFKSVGIDVRVSKTAKIKNPNEVSIGNHVAIDDFVVITTKACIGNYIHIATGVIIFGGKLSLLVMEDFTFISANSTLVLGSDDYVGEGLIGPTVPMKYRKVTYGTTTFKKYSGLGANTTVMPNVTIGEGSVTGASALLTKNIEDWGIYIGVPAKRVRDRMRTFILQYAKEIEENRNE